MHTIAKRFEFSASHQLDHLAHEFPDHQCARLHGHNYVVEIELQAESLSSDGFVVDYGQLSLFKEYIDKTFDHRHLNDVLGGSRDTTAENLSRFFYEVAHSYFPQVSACRVSETGKTWAEYRPTRTAHQIGQDLGRHLGETFSKSFLRKVGP